MKSVHQSQLTVLISVHNGAKTLQRCLESICTQTFNSIAVVFVDDYSADETMQIAENIKLAFPHIPFTILQNEKNLGLTRSLNKGLAVITSPYTARIDADDWWHPEKIQRQMDFAAHHPEYGVIGSNYINYSEFGERTVELPEHDDLIRSTIIRRNPFAHSCVIFITQFIQSLSGYDESVPFAQDYELWLRCMPHTKFFNLQEILCYRSVGESISAKKQKQQMWQGIKIQSKYIQKYNLPLYSYFYMLELFLNLCIPEFIKRLKRRFIV